VTDCDHARTIRPTGHAGSDRGDDRAAVKYTLIRTAKAQPRRSEAWLADVPACINDHDRAAAAFTIFTIWLRPA
jgi:hypothetical protein